MATFIGAFPVLPGKDDDARKFAQETMGRSEEFSASQKRGGVTKEEWSLQQSPMGTLMLVPFEAPDIEKAPVRRPEQLESNRTIAGLQVPVERRSRHRASLPSSSLHHAATWSLVATHGFR